jgi:hypothetical protein
MKARVKATGEVIEVNKVQVIIETLKFLFIIKGMMDFLTKKNNLILRI